jgi:hypothetical protein
VGDALYLQAPFVKEVERLGLVWGFTLKENQPELWREAEHFTQGSPTGVHAERGREIRYWHLPEVDWPVADLRVRVVKTVRIEPQRRVTVSEQDGQRTQGKTAVRQESTNFYATNFELGSISPLFIHQFSRNRRCRCIPGDLEFRMPSLLDQAFPPPKTHFRLPPSSVNR